MASLPETWVEQNIEGRTKYHRILASSTVPPAHIITHSITEEHDVLHVEVLGRHLSKDTTPALSILDGLPKRTTLKKKAALIDTLAVCAGNSDLTMLALADKGGNFFNVRRAVIAKVEHTTIRHVNCAVLIQEGDRCAACSRHRKSLLVKVRRQRKRMEGQPHMNALYKCYPTNTCINYLLHKIQSC